MKKNNNRFNAIVLSAVSNIEGWNKKVKKKKYHLYQNDTDIKKEVKIYRYLNEKME